jgi:hypothetical protein
MFLLFLNPYIFGCSPDQACVGDVLVLTKPLGTQVCCRVLIFCGSLSLCAYYLSIPVVRIKLCKFKSVV